MIANTVLKPIQKNPFYDHKLVLIRKLMQTWIRVSYFDHEISKTSKITIVKK